MKIQLIAAVATLTVSLTGCVIDPSALAAATWYQPPASYYGYQPPASYGYQAPARPHGMAPAYGNPYDARPGRSHAVHMGRPYKGH